MNPDLRSVRAIDVMRTELVWADARETVREAALRMHRAGVRAVLVRGDADGDLPGILTGKDIVNLLGSQDPAVLDHVAVADVMTRPAICVPQQTHLIDCIQLMRMHGVRRVPVVDGVRVVGILSSSDVFARALGC